MNAPATVLSTLPTEPATEMPAPPTTIGRFQVREEIGRGSNGVVYSAHDPVLGREVAIKAVPLTADPQYREQVEAGFLNEARAAGRLSHPHIVTIFDAGRSGDLAYIAMERLHGRDLHEVLCAGNPLPLRQVASLIARVADAVHYAHKRGLIHRDIKPSNIFLLRDGKPKVLDFGVAMPLAGDPGGTQRRQLIGTPNYMSPEQALGRHIDGRSDIFSLGAILYELIAGRRAFDGSSIDETLAQVISDEPAPIEKLRSDVPAPLLAAVRRALAKDVDARYQSAGELRNDLAAFSGGAGTFAGVADRRSRRPASPARLLVAGGSAVALLAALAVGIALLRPPPPAAPAQPPPAAAGAEPKAAPAQSRATTAATANEAARDGRAHSAGTRRAREPAPPAAAATGDGFVTLAVSPWGEVFVDGVSHGVAPPLTRIPLPPGAHLVEIRNGAAPPLRARVEIKAGQTLALQHRF